MFKEEKIILQLTFNPGLTLTGFRTTRPWSLRRGGPLRESLQPQVQTVFIEIATSVLAGFHAGSVSWSNWNLEMLVFVEEGKPENLEKNPRSKTRTIYELNPHVAPGRNGTQATWREEGALTTAPSLLSSMLLTV